MYSKLIAEQIHKCKKAGREPKLILLHPKDYMVLIMEMQSYCIDISEPRTLFGIPIVVTPYVKDFYIVDDRRGCEQSW